MVPNTQQTQGFRLTARRISILAICDASTERRWQGTWRVRNGCLRDHMNQNFRQFCPSLNMLSLCSTAALVLLTARWGFKILKCSGRWITLHWPALLMPGLQLGLMSMRGHCMTPMPGSPGVGCCQGAASAGQGRRGEVRRAKRWGKTQQRCLLLGCSSYIVIN